MTVKKINFLGRHLTREGAAIHFESQETYLDDIVRSMSLEGCRVATTTGTYLVRRLEGYDSPLDQMTHKRYHSLVGKLAWASPIRPDLACAVKELARGLASPTEEDWAKLKNVVRYLTGSLEHRFTVLPKIKITLGTTLELEAFADSD